MGFLVFVALFLIFAPMIMAIIALAKVSGLRAEIDKLKRQVYSQETAERPPQPTVTPQATPVQQPAVPVEKPRPVAIPPRPQPIRSKPPVAPPKPKIGIEFLMGGRAAAFAGIAILVMGIAFLVGYAIQHAWLGPLARVGLGLVCGFILVGIGHWVGRKDEKYTLFSRVLTGGGCSLFYFTVFMAHAFYQLIGPISAGIGLFICAVAVFGLAMLYRSQAVGVLGVLGAFITPILVGGKIDSGFFALVYVALINVPVILLGIRRNWQVLYNLSFVFTTIHFGIWMEQLGAGDLGPGLIFAVVLFLQFALLGLYKLRHEQHVYGRNADLIRLVAASLLLLLAVYGLLHEAGKEGWVGTAFALLALLQFGLAALAYKTLARFTDEITAFVAGGLFAAAMAVPAQLDGAWVSLGWGLEGAILAWFSARVRSRTLQAGAFLLGMGGLFKGLFDDAQSNQHPERLFLNARFIVGLLSAALLGLQGWFAGRRTDDDKADLGRDTIWWVGIAGMLLFFFSDIFQSLGPDNQLSWLLTTFVLLGIGAAVLIVAPPKSTISKLGCILLLAVPVKLLLVDSLLALENFDDVLRPFANFTIWGQLAQVIALMLMFPRLTARRSDLLLPEPTFRNLINLMALAAGLGMVSLEITRIEADWADMGISILWAVSALVAILYGMKKRRPPYRYFGLVLFALTTLKVLVVDSSELKGLERIGAFIITGVLLLALSFAYQKASAYFQSLEE
jgi:uncharacterized membrane protein